MPVTNDEMLHELRNWDLWGPLLFCLTLSVSLSWNAPASTSSTESHGSPEEIFSLVFALFWIGSGVVTLNTKLLHGSVSFFQLLSALGYCLFPLVVSSVIVTVFLGFDINETESPKTKKMIDVIRILLVVTCWLWANKAATVFLSEFIDHKRRILAVYPVVLLYSAFSWMILA